MFWTCGHTHPDGNCIFCNLRVQRAKESSNPPTVVVPWKVTKDVESDIQEKRWQAAVGALSGMMAVQNKSGAIPDNIAKHAFKIADAMIEEWKRYVNTPQD